MVVDSDPGTAEVAPLLTEAQVAEVDELVVVAVGSFGGDEAAMDAVLFALDAGYGGTQIIDALEAGSLTADGTVEGIDPDNVPTDLVIGFRRAAPEPLPVERIREALRSTAADNELLALLGVRNPTDEPGEVAGSKELTLLMALVLAEFPPHAIIESLILGSELTHMRCRAADYDLRIPALRVGNTLYPPEYCGGPEQIDEEPMPSSTDAGDGPAPDATDVDRADDDDGEIEDGVYSGVVDRASDFGQFFSDLQGVAAVDAAEVVVRDGTVTAFTLELSGTGASNLNVATGERLCENPIAITADLTDAGAVEVGGDTAEVPVSFRFVQGVGSGSACHDDSNVAIDQTVDDVATIVFRSDSATATLTAGIGATMTRTE